VVKPRIRGAVAPLALLACASIAGCVDALATVSSAPIPPAVKMEQFASALAARFTNVDRAGRFETARRRLVAGALIPSRVFEDTTVWNAARGPSQRRLVAAGGLTGDAYRFTMSESPGAPMRLGDTRHAIDLVRLRNGEFRWDTSVDFAAGALSSRDLAGVLSGLLAVAEGRTGTQARQAGVAAFPRTAAAMSRLFVIDSLRTARSIDGATAVTLALRVDTRRIDAAFPHFAAYIRRYAEPSVLRFTLTDAAGVTYFDARARDSRLVVRYRVLGGRLVAFTGVQAMPDSLRLSSDLSMKVKMFTVGFRNLVTDFVLSRSADERRLQIVGRTEPEWRLPLVTEHLIRTPLRRPFQGSGALFELAARDVSPGATVIVRHARLEVQESAMLRFLNGLTSHVVNELDANVEREESLFLREVFTAMQADARVLPAFPQRKSAAGQ
jgi:hypothetical protein